MWLIFKIFMAFWWFYKPFIELSFLVNEMKILLCLGLQLGFGFIKSLTTAVSGEDYINS